MTTREGDVFGPCFPLLLFLRGRPVGLEVNDELFQFADFFIQIVHDREFSRFIGITDNAAFESFKICCRQPREIRSLASRCSNG